MPPLPDDPAPMDHFLFHTASDMRGATFVSLSDVVTALSLMEFEIVATGWSVEAAYTLGWFRNILETLDS